MEWRAMEPDDDGSPTWPLRTSGSVIPEGSRVMLSLTHTSRSLVVSMFILLSVALVPAAPATAAQDCRNFVPGANLSYCDFSGFSLIGFDLSGANLRGATFFGTTFLNVNLTGANLHGAVITRSNFNGVTLSGANFSDVTVSGPSPMILRNSNLTNANISGLTMDGAYVDRVDFTGTNWANVTITNTALHDILCPDGTRRDSPCE
jgi:hypothetical protein